MHRGVSGMHDEVHVEIAEIKRELTELYRRVEQADNGINENLNYKYGLLDSSAGSVATSLDAHESVSSARFPRRQVACAFSSWVAQSCSVSLTRCVGSTPLVIG